MKRLLFILLILIGGVSNLFAQHSFELLISTPVTEQILDLVEEESGSFLAVGFEGDYGPQEHDYKGLIIRISKEGDTTINRYSDTDTSYTFRKIMKSNDKHYYVFGSEAFPPEYNHNLLILKMDTNLNIVWKKTYDFNEERHYPMEVLHANNYGFHLVSWVVKDYMPYALLCRLDSNCDTIRTKKTIYNCGGNDVVDALYSIDSSQLYLLGTGYNTGAGSRAVYDTSYNFCFMSSFPEQPVPNMQAKWFTDTTLLFAAGYFNYDPGPQHDDIGISITDTSFSNMNIHRFGAIDTIDYSSEEDVIDFINSDSIFLLGTHNINLDFFPNEVSWISLRQLDRNLLMRTENFYGGDAYYLAFTLLCTSDGGCLISAERYDYQVQDDEYDVYILKLSREDIITGSSIKIPEKKSNTFVYPNPGHDIINIKIQQNTAIFELYSVNGKLTMRSNIRHGLNSISTNTLSPGFYYYNIISNSQVVSTGSWIKK